MKAPRRVELVLITLLLASGGALGLFLKGLYNLLGGPDWSGLIQALVGGLILAFCLLVCLFIIYQMDRGTGRIKRKIPLFEMGPQFDEPSLTMARRGELNE